MSRLGFTTNGDLNSIRFIKTGATTARVKWAKSSVLGQRTHGEIISGSVLTFTLDNNEPGRPAKATIATPTGVVKSSYFYEFDVVDVETDADILPNGIEDLNSQNRVFVFTSAGGASATAPPASHTLGSHSNVSTTVDSAGAGDDQKALVWDNASGQYVLGAVAQPERLHQLDDVTLTNEPPTAAEGGHTIVWDNTLGYWKNVNPSTFTHSLGAGQTNVNASVDAPANNSNSLFWNTTEWAERQPAMTDLSDTDHGAGTKLDGTVLRYDATSNTYSHRPPTTRPLRQTKAPEQTGSAQTGRLYWLNPTFKIHQWEEVH